MANTTITPGKANATLSQTAPIVRSADKLFSPAAANRTLSSMAPVVSRSQVPQLAPEQSPTSDIRFLQQLDFPAYAVELDWLLTDQNLIADGYDLQSAVIVALGTDALAPPDEALPDPDETDRRGWWGDMDADLIWGGWPVGSLLWLLSRAKLTGPLARGGSTLARADGWTRDAMKPFVQRLIASRIDVVSAQLDTDRIDVGVTIYRGPEPAIELRYSELWDELGRH